MSTFTTCASGGYSEGFRPAAEAAEAADQAAHATVTSVAAIGQ